VGRTLSGAVSRPAHMVEIMFDGSLPEAGDLAALSDAAVVDAVGGWARVEAAAASRKQAALAEMFARRTGLDADERELWWVDPEAAVTAELAAALNVSRGMALHQTHRGVALRDRLPKVAELFAAGQITDMLVRAIVWGTYLINDPEIMAKVDAALAEQITTWGPLSVAKTEQAIDALVEQYDAGALRHGGTRAQSREVRFGSLSDEAGFTSMWARLYAADAAVLKRRVDELARSVCDGDQRTAGERRADAMTALATGQSALACECGHSDCEAAGREVAPAVTTVVHVVADAASVAEATAEPAVAIPVDDTAGVTEVLDQRSAAYAAPGEVPTAPPAFVMGGGIMPTSLLAATLKRAMVREVRHPGDAPPEPQYRPSTKLAEFVRCRDLTCRWPGCDRPADVCDLDHTVPYRFGPTHASNLKCLCRFHHLLKTFWGWRDRQHPDGTVVWTTPTGHRYTTRPGSALLFPTLCEPTSTLWIGEPPVVEPTDTRAVMMPKRRRTRAHNIARAMSAERRLNDEHVAERNRPLSF
jgi:hypothetical protein